VLDFFSGRTATKYCQSGLYLPVTIIIEFAKGRSKNGESMALVSE